MKLQIKMISVLFLLLVLLGAKSEASVKKGAPIENSVVIQNDNFLSETLSITFDHQYGFLPVVEMKIRNKTAHLIVDTGADWVTLGLKPSVLESLDEKYSIRGKKSVDVFGKKYQEKCFNIPSAKLGNLELSNLTASEELRSFVPEDGIIGNGLLKRFHILFDYPASKVVLYSKCSYPQELDLAGWMKVPFIHNKIGILIEGKLGKGGKKLKFCFDSGYSAAIERDKSVGMIQPQHAGLALKGITYIQTEHFYLGDSDLGPMGFMVHENKQPPVSGFIGHNILANYQVFIDFDKGFLFLKRPNK